MTATASELRVSDLMTRKVFTLTPVQSLPLAETMMGLLHVRHVPVVDGAGRLVGLVTHRDLLAAKISALAPLSDDERSSLQLAVPVSQVMRTDVWTIHSTALAVSAARIMQDHRLGCLPVIDDDRLVGILTQADLLTLVVDSLTLERKAPSPTVEKVMTLMPATIDANTTLAEARSMMSRFNIRHLPVLSDGRPVAIVSDRDLRVAEVIFAEMRDTRAAHAVRLLESAAPVRRVARDAPLDAVLDDMFHERNDAVLVVDGERLVGILTAADACRILSERLHERLERR